MVLDKGGTRTTYERLSKFCSNGGLRPFPRAGEIKIKQRNILTKFKSLFRQNHWYMFNQILHKAVLGKWDLCLFKCGAPLFSNGIITKKQNLKIILSKIIGPISTKLGTEHPCMKETRFFATGGPFDF